MNMNNANTDGLSISREGKLNPTLMYKGEPMLKIGPISESDLFGFAWESKSCKHGEWLKWMKKYDFGYGRVYPESGLFCSILSPSINSETKSDGKIFPYDIVRWEENKPIWEEKQPIFDLSKPNKDYWINMAKIIKKCAEQGIVLHLQLYQRCYFTPTLWHTCFFNPNNNINNFKIGDKSFNGIESGYNYFTKMLEDSVIWQIHKTYILNILEAIGNNGNVFIDLMNEPGEWNHSNSFRRWGMSKEWVEKTLDIIEEWEKENNIHILKGMLLDGLDNEEYVNSNSRMDLIIISANRIVYGMIGNFLRYKKPIVSVHNRFCPFWPGPKEKKSLMVDDELFSRKRFYQWMGMTQKIQGLGVYAKNATTTDLKSENANKYGYQSKVLIDIFNNIKDYGNMHIGVDHIYSGPGFYKTMLLSDKEILIYMHTEEFGKIIAAGEVLRMRHLPLVKDKVKVKIINPASGKMSIQELEIKEDRLNIELPEFVEDIAIYISV